MNGTSRGVVIILALLGIALWMRRRKTHSLEETIEANWRQIKRKLPAGWAKEVPRKRKQALQLINHIHESTGESRRRIRKTLAGLAS